MCCFGNLGDIGPGTGPNEMRFAGVGQALVGGVIVDIDLVVTAPLTGDGAYAGSLNLVENQRARNGVVTGETETARPGLNLVLRGFFCRNRGCLMHLHSCDDTPPRLRSRLQTPPPLPPPHTHTMCPH